MASSSSSSGGSHMRTDPRSPFQDPGFPGLGGGGGGGGGGRRGAGGGGNPMTGSTGPEMKSTPQFDIFEWHPRYISCQKYFLDHSQHDVPVQALAAFLNILLPCQRYPNPVMNSAGSASPTSSSGRTFVFATPGQQTVPMVSLIPYIRRLVATGMDFPGVLHGFFGDDWASGIGSLHEQERRNFLFAARSGEWAAVKRDYDMPPLETVPFLRPLQGATAAEIEAADRTWSEWLHHQGWGTGQRQEDGQGGAAEPYRQHGKGRA